MNNLSWLIYLADRVQVIAPICFLLLVLFIIFVMVYPDEHGSSQHPFYGVKKGNFPKYYLLIPVFLLSLIIFTPSEKAVYLIAGSEISEEVVTSEEGKEVLRDIKTILKEQIKEMKKEN